MKRSRRPLPTLWEAVKPAFQNRQILSKWFDSTRTTPDKNAETYMISDIEELPPSLVKKPKTDDSPSLKTKKIGLRTTKSQGNVLYTKGGNIKPKKTSDIKLTNTMQNSEEKDLRATADYLIIIDSTNHSMAIISYKQVVDNYSTELSDGFKCQIPIDKLEFLVRPEEVSYLALRDDILNYAGEKRRIQDEYTSQFF